MPARRGTWCSATVLALRPSPSWWIGSVRRRAAGAAEAAAAGDIVGVTVPLKASRPVPVEPLRGKPVIDINNYYPDRDGHIAELDDESTTVTEALVSLLRPAAGPSPGVARGKALNNLYVTHRATLPRPAGHSERSVLPIAGDDAEAKQAETDFLDSIGYDA